MGDLVRDDVARRIDEECRRDVVELMSHATGEFEGLGAAVEAATAPPKPKESRVTGWLRRLLLGNESD